MKNSTNVVPFWKTYRQFASESQLPMAFASAFVVGLMLFEAHCREPEFAELIYLHPWDFLYLSLALTLAGYVLMNVVLVAMIPLFALMCAWENRRCRKL